MGSKYFTANELKERWNLKSVKKIYEMRKKKMIPYTEIGGQFRFPVDKIIEWEKSQTVLPNKEIPDTVIPDTIIPDTVIPDEKDTKQNYE